MLEIVLAVIGGIVVGLWVGLLPGINVSTAMLLLYPVLFAFDLTALFAFYFAAINSSQYFGSISAIVYGVAGELSSIPAVKHGHAFFKQGRGNEALIYTANASVLASFFAIAMFWVLNNFPNLFSIMMSADWRTSVFILAIGIMIIMSDQRPLAAVLTLAGLIIGQIGFNEILSTRFMTFDIAVLDGGIPFFPIFCGLIVLPLLLTEFKTQTTLGALPASSALSIRFRYLFMPGSLSWPVIRGSVVGFFAGLIPGSSYTISSNLADSLESKWQQIKATPDPMARLVSAEAANNSGSVSVLIPLVVMAIPIVASEAIVLGIAESKGFGYTVSFDYFQQNLHQIIGLLITINLINWVIAGTLYRCVARMFYAIQNKAYVLTMMLTAIIMIWHAWMDHLIMVSLLVFVLSFGLGIIIKSSQAKMCLVFGFFVSNYLIDDLYRLLFF